MGNVCGGSRLQVHIQESFTYETILDRYIETHLQEMMLNAVQTSDRRASQGELAAMVSTMAHILAPSHYTLVNVAVDGIHDPCFAVSRNWRLRGQ